jgi:stage II sporulation protein AA (anti-sigma F factor antagonist)
VHVQHSPTGRVAVLALHGEVDITRADSLRRTLLDLIGAPLIVVDLAGVTFLDSTVLGVLVGAARRAEVEGGRLIVLNEAGLAARVLQVSGLRRVLSAVG